MKSFCIMAVLCLALVTVWAGGGEPLKPVADGPEGQRAFDDLKACYTSPTNQPPVERAVRELGAADAAARQRAGRYLWALFQQSFADEHNGRAVWEKSEFWGGGAGNQARELGQQMAKTFGDLAQGEEALDAAVWLLQEERLAGNQAQGMQVLARIESRRAMEALRQILAQPHPNEAVLTVAIEVAGQRKRTELAPEIRALCQHYRTAIRKVARAAAPNVGLEKLPENDPGPVFTPWLADQIRAIAGMVADEIPAEAVWVRCKVPADEEYWHNVKEVEVSGWLLSEKDNRCEILDVFARRRTVPKAVVRPRTLSEDVTAMTALRKRGDREDLWNALSRMGAATAQFEPDFISIPEALIAAWAFAKGDQQSAGAILLPRIEDTADDRWVFSAARDLLGHSYHQAMLVAFSHDRDYAETLRLARHLSKPVFNGYRYQERAQELAAQIEKRQDDFKTFRLPTAAEWSEQKAKLNRAGQVQYLAARLRLLNCIQLSQPGGLNIRAKQMAEPFRKVSFKGTEVINPYSELRAMKLEIAELPELIPFLADENFVLAFSYWRDFHPDRQLHRVNEAVADIVNDVAKRDLANLKVFAHLPAEGKQQHLQSLRDWCQAHTGKSRKELILDTLRTGQNWYEIKAMGSEALQNKYAEAAGVLLQRMQDFPQQRGEIAALCFAFGTAEVVGAARQWVKDPDDAVRFWGALSLVKQGARDQHEGLQPLQGILDKDDGGLWYPRAFETLLAAGYEEALQTACKILDKKSFDLYGNAKSILLGLFLAGRKECLAFLLTRLDDGTKSGQSSGKWQRQAVERERTVADEVAAIIASWQLQGTKYNKLAPEEERKQQREQLKRWIQTQFNLIQAKQPPEMKTTRRPVQGSEWQLDAP